MLAAAAAHPPQRTSQRPLPPASLRLKLPALARAVPPAQPQPPPPPRALRPPADKPSLVQ